MPFLLFSYRNARGRPVTALIPCSSSSDSSCQLSHLILFLPLTLFALTHYPCSQLFYLLLSLPSHTFLSQLLIPPLFLRQFLLQNVSVFLLPLHPFFSLFSLSLPDITFLHFLLILWSLLGLCPLSYTCFPLYSPFHSLSFSLPSSSSQSIYPFFLWGGVSHSFF